MYGRNVDGGWGYFAHKSSRIEPTCWALLAIGGSGRIGGNAAALGAAEALLGRQRTDGLLTDVPGSLNLGFNGLATVALRAIGGSGESAADTVLNGLVAHRGVRAEQSEWFRQDNTLQGWPWIDDTFSWVEPTAWCLLALKVARRSRPVNAARIAEAEALLIDRTCRTGGWNYGNANAIGKDLWAYVPTTALGLLAMQDRREHEAIEQGVDFLRANRTSEPSGMALGMTAICFAVLGLPIADLQLAIAAQCERLIELGNLHVLALALYALTIDEHHARTFRL